MRHHLLPFLLLHLLFLHPLFSQNPSTVNCDTVTVVAQASSGHLTCDVPSTTLVGALHPTALSYAWSGPQGFSSNKREVLVTQVGTYTLQVTGPYGCTKQATVTVKDNCTFYPLEPPACPDAFVPPAESCPETCVYPYIIAGIPYYSTASYQGNGIPPGGFCSNVQNDQWFAFVAGATSGTITALSSNCANGDGIQMALYPSCSEAPIVCNEGQAGGGNTPISISPTNLTIGKVYYLMVDGYSGDLCDFEFVIPNGICNGPSGTSGGPTSVSGLPKVCPQAIATYAHNAPVGATVYLWTGPPGSSFDGIPTPAVIYAPAGKKVVVAFGTESGLISVRALYYFSPPSPPVNIPVIVEPLPKTIFPPVTVCAEDLPYKLPWEEEVSFVGTQIFKTILTSYLGCDSILEQKVTAKPPISVNLGTITRCEGSCFQINGVEYCESGFHTEVLESYQGCDSVVAFNLNILRPVAQIIGNGTITCATPSITLSSQPSQGVKIWRNAAGTAVGSGNILAVTQPGIYTLTTTMTSGGISCTKQAQVTILADIATPTATAQGGTLTCSAPSLQLQGSSSFPATTWHWSGPGGFSSTMPNPQVTQPGTYTLTVTNASNGCTNTATAIVTANQTAPGASASGGTLTCSVLQVQLAGSSPDPTAALLWTGPGGFSSTLPNPMASEPGGYTLTATATNGCKSVASTIVAADQALPMTNISAPGVLTCVALSTVLQVNADLPITAYAWSGPGGFSSNQANPVVSVAGEYSVVVTAANGCENAADVTVLADQQTPTVSATDATLTCTAPSATLQVNADLPIAAYTWSGPGGFSSNQANPVVSVAGEYSVVVTAANGCENAADVTVLADQQTPTVSATDATLTCTAPSATLQVNADLPIAAYTWSGPGGFSSNQATPVVSVAGEYSVVVTAANGCENAASATVLADQQTPTVSAADATLTCAAPSATLQVNADLPIAAYAWSGPGSFSSNQATPVVSVAGEYSVVVTAANGCTSTASSSVTAPAQYTDFIVETTQPDCPNQTNGTASASLNGGLPPYNFLWSNGLTSSSISNIGIGTYSLTVTDQNGCTTSTSVELAAVDQQPPTVTAQPATLGIGADGTALVTLTALQAQATDNCGAVTLSIAPSTFDCSKKGPQTVVLTATDLAGLTSTTAVTVMVMDNLSPVLTCPASIRVCAPANTVLYEAPSASDNCPLVGGSLKQTSGLPSGATFPVGATTTQTYTFTDAGGNTGACSFDVTVTQPVVFEKITITAATVGLNNGAIDVSISGGTEPHTFAWTLGGQTVGNTLNLSGLAPGTYSLLVTDAEGCTYTLPEVFVKTASFATEPTWLAGISLRPNPAEDWTWVVFAEKAMDALEINVLDAVGKSVLRLVSESQTAIQLDCSSLPAGVYWVRFSTRDESGLRRLIIQR